MELKISTQSELAKVLIEKQYEKEGILYVEIAMTQPEGTVPEKFMLEWKMPMADCYSIWSPDIRNGRGLGMNWSKRTTNSRLSNWMPLHSCLTKSGQNRIAVAVSDAKAPIAISSGVCEEDACIDFRITFFTQPVAPLSSYRATVRIDTRDIPYYDSIYDSVCWWETECGYVPADVPEGAFLPVNSLWYSYHQNIDTEDVLKECRLSKELGLDLVIIDDGWQTDDNNRGYSHCGDWEVATSKIPDMKDFVAKIHEIGMKVMLWYSMPYVGIHSKNYERFKTMFLEGVGNGKNFWGLDPRYPQVRAFLVEQYANAIKNWDLDGLKLDFIDAFVLRGESSEPDSRRDMESLEEAVDVLMTEVTTALKAIKPDVLLEFRQSYVGPAIRKYGNMLRVMDCPGSCLTNRNEIVNLRLTSGKTAVHSDMLMWDYNAPVEAAALQLASVLFAVPQVSMKMEKLSEEHKKMLAHYLAFWKENRDTLLFGKLTAKASEGCYSQATSRLDGKSVTTAYNDRVIVRADEDAFVGVNATGEDELIVKNAAGFSYCVVTCTGEPVSQGVIQSGIEALCVPVGGMVIAKQ